MKLTMGLMACFLVLFGAILELSAINGGRATAFQPSYEATPPDQEPGLDVTDFGAIGDGKTDDSKAFISAWNAACSQISDSVNIIVPNGKTFLLSPIHFQGPCKCVNIIFEILGSIVAQPKLAWKNKRGGEWLIFDGVDNLNVVGNGQGLIDGQGDSWWKYGDNSRPTALRFSRCNNLIVSGLKHVNSPKFHIFISDCHNVNFTRLHIIAPQNSPNTDGIDITSSSNLRIHNCTIETGDDCIAIKGGTSDITISKVNCGPGHGISVGSLGEGGKRDEVESVIVTNCTFNGTHNGVRIKTWQGGSGFARTIRFSSINFIAVNNPVIIDQFYCPHKVCTNKMSAVEVSDVRYSGLMGTSLCNNATISLRCSDTVPCRGIVIDDVDIKSTDPHKPPVAMCANAHGTATNTSSPVVNCLI